MGHHDHPCLSACSVSSSSGSATGWSCSPGRPPASGRRYGPGAVTLGDGTAAGLRPSYPGDQHELVKGERLFSANTRYQRFLGAADITPALARYLAKVDYVNHFTWVAVDSADVPVGGATYVRSASDRALADISFLIEDEFQGRGLGTLLMGAIAIAARRNGISHFCADVLAGTVHARHP